MMWSEKCSLSSKASTAPSTPQALRCPVMCYNNTSRYPSCLLSRRRFLQVEFGLALKEVFIVAFPVILCSVQHRTTVLPSTLLDRGWRPLGSVCGRAMRSGVWVPGIQG